MCESVSRSSGANWEFAEGSAPRTTLSFRTSAPASVGICIEFRAAYRHTVRSILPFSGIHPREVVRLLGGLPRQCDHWLAMTRNSIARQIPICCVAVLSRYVHRKMSNTNTRRCLTIMRQRRVLGLISGIPGPPGSGDPPAGSGGYNRSARRFPPPPVPPHPA